MIKKNVILFVIVTIVTKIQCQHPVSCPHIFSYVQNPRTGAIEGRIKITDTRFGPNMVSIIMTYSKNADIRNSGSIKFVQGHVGGIIAREVYYHHPIIYRVIFPTSNVLPIIKEIISNGRIICNNPVPRRGVRHMALHHRSNVPNITPLAATNNQIPNRQLPNTFRPPGLSRPTISSNICGTTNFPINLIYGGIRTTPGAWPWLVPIFIRNRAGEQKYICAGNIIAPHATITAAHCVIDNGRLYRTQDVLIGLGIYNIHNWNQAYTHIARVSKIISHPEYSVKSIYDADIAIIFLDKSYSYNHLIRPVCIWSGSRDLNAVINRNGRVAGWGQSKPNGIRESEPNIVNTQIVSSEKCLRSNEAFTSITTSRNFCAGYRNGKGPCKGDSGSGLIMDLGGKWYIRGIVSGSLQHATTTCDLKEYAVYTDVAQFVNWIRSYVH